MTHLGAYPVVVKYTSKVDIDHLKISLTIIHCSSPIPCSQLPFQHSQLPFRVCNRGNQPRNHRLLYLFLIDPALKLDYQSKRGM